MNKKRILVAPLNWGLGHATRCIPIIEALQKNGFEPVLASDGIALALLKKEFPQLTALELPSYKIQYAQNGANFKWKLFRQIPNMFHAVRNERKTAENWIEQYNIDGIISDNRLGVHSKKVPTVFITHQLNVLTGNTSWLTTKIHHHFIRKFDICWIPDVAGKPNLSGKLGHLNNSNLNLKYIGPLSRFNKKETEEIYDLMVILSGPEPQRTLLEEKLNLELKNYDGTILFVRGVVEEEQKISKRFNCTYYNFMNTAELEIAFNQSKMILCRSGYTTIMDLAKLDKKAFFIPTPGQYEQEYLAKKLTKKGVVPSSKQDSFKAEHLLQVSIYKGLKDVGKNEVSLNELLSIFS
ncbi:glycosyltransferase family 28 [Flavobacterium limnosediminis JC2902]|uniref:Glycosyltransferase family 28 n=1 Tax=Flavobacterium limnosediminis JC2902 TaxID=1341181 RepID=V6SSV8_9FLAO|nr:glycosyltransferase [Flavobacterium limnosediminis]ESU29716.1 glycosyltransferase family 28 [Flavobacterium limnosediminis JC2902]